MSGKIYITHVYELTDRALYSSVNPLGKERDGLKCVAIAIGDLSAVDNDFEDANPDAHADSHEKHCMSSLRNFHAEKKGAA